MPGQTVRTTIALPAELLEAADRAVQEGKARSRNQLVTAALRRELEAQERAAIDAAFRAMGDDAEAQEQALSLVEEFALADLESLEAGEPA